MSKQYYVYILASGRNGTIYIGVTGDIGQRGFEHKNKFFDGFTKRYNVTLPVNCEAFERIEDAIAREKAMKKWKRAWNLELIEKSNPEWRDLFEVLI